MKKIAIVTPMYREQLSPDEKLSLRHLDYFLPSHQRIVIAPPSLNVPLSNITIERFPARYFADIAAYNRLLLTEEFYARFASFDYILIYQLDCLVLSNALDHWCDQGWDYIGAPWLTDFASFGGPGVGLWKVGNGGFSLRRVASFLQVFREYDPRNAADIYWEQIVRRFPGYKRLFRLPKLALKRLPIRAPLHFHLGHNKAMEDWFWGVEATYYFPGFKVAPPEEALSFAFEMDPAFCFARNNYRLPFGVHAWQRYDRKFWERHLKV
jgi:hypothetical protein